MKKSLPLLCALLSTSFFASPAYAEDTSYLSLSIGYYDINDDYEAADFRVEYRPERHLGIENLKPWIGVEVTSDLSGWAGGGILYDWEVSDNVYITPSFGAGVYGKGSSDKDLGHVIEFRSQLEAGYEFENNTRAGLAISHLSNASLDDNNPGTEVLSVYYHVPFQNAF